MTPRCPKDVLEARYGLLERRWRKIMRHMGLRLLAALVVTLTAVLPFAHRGPSLAVAQELPTLPDPVAVTVDRAATALLVLDMNDPVCATRPPCVETVPTVVALLERARAEGLTVMHSTTLTANGWLPEVTPRDD